MIQFAMCLFIQFLHYPSSLFPNDSSFCTKLYNLMALLVHIPNWCSVHKHAFKCKSKLWLFSWNHLKISSPLNNSSRHTSDSFDWHASCYLSYFVTCFLLLCSPATTLCATIQVGLLHVHVHVTIHNENDTSGSSDWCDWFHHDTKYME